MPANTATNTPTPGVCNGAYHFFDPQPGAPANGGTVNVGDRFVLDLKVYAALYGAPDGLTAQQAYMTYTSQLLQNARVSSIGTSCVPTNTVTGDLSVFDATLQNEVCNGPNPCNFRGVLVDPGSFAYASGALVNCPTGCPDPDQPPPQNQQVFRIAQVGFCASAVGRAVIHWQFAPPAPAIRDTKIVDFNSNVVNPHACYVDYVVNVVAPTSTPTITNTPVNTPTYTPTSTFTNTPTDTPTDTFTVTPTNTPTNTTTSTPTNTFTSTPTNTATNTATSTFTNTPTSTPTNTATSTFTSTPTSTPTYTPTNTSTDTPTFTPTSTATNTPTFIPTNTTTNTATNTPTSTSTDTPTPLPTNTPTNTPVLMAHVDWQGRSAQPDPSQQLPVTLTLKTGSTEINYTGLITDASGVFTVPVSGLDAGAYNWRVKGPKYLAKGGAIDLTGAPVTNLEVGQMLVGDANNDNLVNIVDFNTLKISFGKQAGQPGYDDRTEFTGDQIVNIVDFNLEKRTFGLPGAPPI